MSLLSTLYFGVQIFHTVIPLDSSRFPICATRPTTHVKCLFKSIISLYATSHVECDSEITKNGMGWRQTGAQPLIVNQAESE